MNHLMSKRAVKLVKTARNNIIKKRKMNRLLTPPQSPDNRSDSKKVLALDKKRRETRRANRLAHQNNHFNNLIPIQLNLDDNDDANNLPNQSGCILEAT
jgi:hypothetical protein